MGGGGIGGRCECADFGLVGWRCQREQVMVCEKHFLISNGAHRTENQPLRCWTR